MNQKIKKMILIILLGFISGNSIIACNFCGLCPTRRNNRNEKKISKKNLSREARIVVQKNKLLKTARKVALAVRRGDTEKLDELHEKFEKRCYKLREEGHGRFVDDIIQGEINMELVKQTIPISKKMRDWIVKHFTIGTASALGSGLIGLLFVIIKSKYKTA